MMGAIARPIIPPKTVSDRETGCLQLGFGLLSERDFRAPSAVLLFVPKGRPVKYR